MRKLLKGFILQSLGSIVITVLVYIATGSILKSVIIFLILLLLGMIKPVLLILNKLTKRTNWYKNRTEDVTKFCKNIPMNLDICNLGSNSGKFAFDYESTGLKGENWALGPQTLSYDFRVLKNYFSFLKEGATVLIPLCPFSSCIKDFEDDKINYKYYSFLHPILISNYSQITSKKVMRFVNKPFQVSPIRSILRILHDLPIDNNKIMDIQSIEVDAQNFINNWKQQFSIADLDAPVSVKNKDCITYNRDLLKDMITFCVERNLKPVIVIPPVTRALSSKLSEKFRGDYIYSLIKEVNMDQVLFLNYFDDERFIDPNLYFNSYFLNQKGRKIFTRQILSDLDLI
jgi:hypothetical protein